MSIVPSISPNALPLAGRPWPGACAIKFSLVNSEKFKEVSSWTGIGIACEKLSHFNSQFVDIYIKNKTGVQKKTEDSSNDRISIAPTHTENCIFCTEVVDENYWIDAKSAYNNVYTLLAEQSVNNKIKNSASTLVSSARSAGYFFLCDYFRIKDNESLKKSKYCLQIALKIFESGNYPFRKNDIQNILEITSIAQNQAIKDYK